MKKFVALAYALVVLSYSILPVCAAPYEFRSDVKFTKDVEFANSSIASSSLNAAVRDEEVVIPLNGGAIMADGITYEIPVGMLRSGTVTAAYVSCGIRVAGGTNTLLLAKRNGGTEVTMLSTANVDPTAVPAAAFTAQALTLTGTATNLAFVAGDCIIGRIVCGTMTTDGKGYTLTVRFRPTDQ